MIFEQFDLPSNKPVDHYSGLLFSHCTAFLYTHYREDDICQALNNRLKPFFNTIKYTFFNYKFLKFYLIG